MVNFWNTKEPVQTESPINQESTLTAEPVHTPEDQPIIPARPFSFLNIIDFDTKLGIPGTNDIVQDLLDDQEYQANTKYQQQLEEKDSEIREKDKQAASLEGTIELMKVNDEQRQVELKASQDKAEKLQAELEQAKKDRNEAQQSHQSLVNEHTKLQGDHKVTAVENEQLKEQLEQQKQTAAAGASIEIASSTKYQDRISKIDSEVEAKKKTDWGSLANIGLRRFGLEPITPTGEAADPEKKEDLVTAPQLQDAFRSDDEKSQVVQSDTGSTGVQAAAEAVDTTTYKESPDLEQFQQLMKEVTDLRTWQSDMNAWKDSESSWRVGVEKTLEGHGIVINGQPA